MKKESYYFGIFFVGLYAVATLFQMVLRLQLGPRIFTPPAYLPWFSLTVCLDLIASGALLSYFHYKNYGLALSAGVLSLLALLCQAFVIYSILARRELGEYYQLTAFAVLGTAVLYGISLTFSQTKERAWLKAAGIFMLSSGLILTAIWTWQLNTLDASLRGTLEKVLQGVSRATIVIPMLFIVNFWHELKTAKVEGKNSPLNPWQTGLMVAVALTAVVSAVLLGQRLLSDSLMPVQPHAVSEKARALAARFEARMYTDSQGDTLRYRLMPPLDYDPTQRYPLVLCLHHGGTHGVDNINQVEGSFAPFLANYNNRRAYPAFLLVPQSPQGTSFLDPSIDRLVLETIQVLEKEFSIDPKRRYVMGLSGGGFGSWHFITAHPKMFAAAVPICGGGDSRLAPAIVDVPVWAFHGGIDELAPVRGSRDMIGAIRAAGGTPRYTEFPGAGHDIGGQVQKTPGLLDWLFAQKKK